MIPAGTCFCHRCGSMFKDAYYKSGMHPVGAKLRRPAHSIGAPQWEVEPFRPDGGEIRLEETPWFSSVVNERNGVPDSIKCTFGRNPEKIEMRRACPVCREDTILVKDCGRYPTYIVAMVGARATGKSTWLKAIATDINLYAVNENAAYPYEIDFLNKFSIKDWDLGATLPDSAGVTNYLRIKKRGSETPIANVIFLDAAGELFQMLTKEDSKLRRFILGDGEYTGVDAVIYMESAELELKQDLSKEDRERANNSFQVYKEMGQIGALDNRPLAFVYTHADKACQDGKNLPKVWDMSDQREVPVFTKDTFRGKTSYAPAALRPRFLQEDIIARSINTTVLKHTGKNRQGFMVQTCENKTQEDGTPLNDSSKNFNVMDPLLWILSCLRLFPIPQK